jgi:shikimate dehydrogenase
MKRFAVVGQPISHSRSPEIFAALSAASGIALAYERIEIAPDDFARVFADARERFDGWNVTAPHKERALVNADEASANARAVGAANVLSFRNRRAAAANTDVEGVIALLGSQRIDPAGRTVTILGAGGAARATALALRDLGATRVVIANRSPERAARLVADLQGAMGATALAAAEPPVGAPLVINATSDGGAVAAVGHTCSADGWCVDLQYKPAETPFVRAARESGRRALNGTTMLVAQAIATFRIWFGDDVALDAERVSADLARIVEAA